MLNSVVTVVIVIIAVVVAFIPAFVFVAVVGLAAAGGAASQAARWGPPLHHLHAVQPHARCSGVLDKLSGIHLPATGRIHQGSNNTSI